MIQEFNVTMMDALSAELTRDGDAFKMRKESCLFVK